MTRFNKLLTVMLGTAFAFAAVLFAIAAQSMSVHPQWNQTVLFETMWSWTGRALIFDATRGLTYAQTVDAAGNGYLTAFDRTGRLMWNVTDATSDDGDIDRSELGYDDETGVLCYVITPLSTPGQVRAVNGSTGSVIWQWSNWTESMSGMPAPFATTTPNGQRLFLVGATAMHALDATTGQLLSRIPLQIDYGYARVPNSPLLIVGSWQLAAIDLSNITLAWMSNVQTPTGAQFYAYAKPTPDGKTFFVLAEDGSLQITAVDVLTGAVDPGFGMPFVPPKSKIVATTNEIVIVAATPWDGQASIRALNRTSGSVMWLKNNSDSALYCTMLGGQSLVCCNSTTVFRLDPQTGAPFGAGAAGKFYPHTPYDPIIAASTVDPDQLQMVYYAQATAVNELVSAGLIVGAEVQFTPAPSTPTPSPTASPSIIVEQFDGPSCQSGATDTLRYTCGCTVLPSGFGSVSHACVPNSAGVVQLWSKSFDHSSSCNGSAQMTGVLDLNRCEQSPDGLSSWLLVACPTN